MYWGEQNWGTRVVTVTVGNDFSLWQQHIVSSVKCCTPREKILVGVPRPCVWVYISVTVGHVNFRLSLDSSILRAAVNVFQAVQIPVSILWNSFWFNSNSFFLSIIVHCPLVGWQYRHKYYTICTHITQKSVNHKYSFSNI